MKNKINQVTKIFIFVCLISLGLTSCEPPHEHTYSDEWFADNSYHWHAATCEHADVVSNKEAHVGEWKIIQEATENTVGKKKLICTVCKKEIIKEFEFTEPQAEAIVVLRLYSLTNTDVVALQEEKEKLETKG